MQTVIEAAKACLTMPGQYVLHIDEVIQCYKMHVG